MYRFSILLYIFKEMVNRNLFFIPLSCIIILGLILFNACKTKAQIRLETGSKKAMPKEWIDAHPGHKIIRLSPEEGNYRSFYFHNNPFIPALGNEGDIMVFYGSLFKQPAHPLHKRRRMKQLYTLNLKTQVRWNIFILIRPG